jgi:hypothetical protein
LRRWSLPSFAFEFGVAFEPDRESRSQPPGESGDLEGMDVIGRWWYGCTAFSRPSQASKRAEPPCATSANDANAKRAIISANPSPGGALPARSLQAVPRLQ